MIRNLISELGIALVLLFLLPAALPAQEPSTLELEARATVIVNGRVADGTGKPLRKASVRISGGRIRTVGKFKPTEKDRIVDATGLVLAPGFIDIHNHSISGLETDPLAESQIAQGITSLVVGADGESPWPVLPWLEGLRKNPPSLNVALLVGHATIRRQAMGKDFKRQATTAEIETMTQLAEQAFESGAIGLSSGLEYEVGSYSATEELVALARVAARHGGFYMTHVRDEGNRSFEALKEEIAIGEKAGIAVQHSHIKLGTVSVWGKAPDYIRRIVAARKQGLDFLADCYPYDAWHSGIKVILPDKQYENPQSVEKALADNGGADSLTITAFPPHPEYEFHTLAELAAARGISPVAMYSQIIREGDAADAEAEVIGKSMIEKDIKAFYQQPWVMVASDGGIGSQHPRGAGTFPRVLGLYVRQKHWLSLPDAIRKMTSLPAGRLGWKDRGVIRQGAAADLVLFNPETVIDHSTFAKPLEFPAGIEKVFVNGDLVWDQGRPTGSRPGRVLP